MQRKPNLAEWAVVLAVMGGSALVVYPFLSRAWEKPKPPCQSNLKMIGLGFAQYRDDSGDTFPAVRDRVSGLGWVETLQPYLKSTEIFQCPTEPNGAGESPDALHFSDYWMNRRLSSQSGPSLNPTAWQWTILAGDGNDGANATTSSYALSDLPSSWRQNPQSPARRHQGLANYLFADGHVKAFAPDKILTWAPQINAPTFAIR